MSIQKLLRQTLEKRFDKVEKLSNTKHWNVFRVYRDGMPLIAKAIVAAIDEPADDKRAAAAFKTESTILKMLPPGWGKTLVDSFIDGPFRVIVTNDIDVVSWPDGPITVEQYKTIRKQLDWLHENGIAHGDMERKNVLLSIDGKPIIIDFEKSILHASKGKKMADIALLDSWARSIATGGANVSGLATVSFARGGANTIYKINPNNGNPTLEIVLRPGETILTNQDVMIYMDGRMGIDYKMGGSGAANGLSGSSSGSATASGGQTRKQRNKSRQKTARRQHGAGLMSAVARGIAGESFFHNVIANPSSDSNMNIVLSTRLPGSIVAIPLRPGVVWNVGPGSFIAATHGTRVSGDLNLFKHFKGVLVGEGPVYTSVELKPGVESGTLWIGSYGGVEQKNIDFTKDVLFINNGNFLAMPIIIDGVDVWKEGVKVGLPASIIKSYMTDVGFVLKVGGVPDLRVGPIPIYLQTHNPGNLVKFIKEIAKDVAGK